jgi:cation diffusion facilitator family transporter
MSEDEHHYNPEKSSTLKIGHSHDNAHDHSHEHEHEHGPIMGWLFEAIPFLHGHSHSEAHVDRALETNSRGIWAVKVSLVGLLATSLFQFIIVILSGSVSLLADTIHNFSDAFTAIPLWIAFILARRPATRRYTYGFGRAEDIAGVIIVLMIFLSSLVAGYESIQRFFNPEPIRYVGWVIAAAIVGFIGNEGVAIFRIRVGQQIGSAALIADGQHARVDGLTSLAVLLGVIGSILGFPIVDPIIGGFITIAILLIVKDTAVTMWHRLMDAVDPALVEKTEQITRAVVGVHDVHDVRLRWIGYSLHMEIHITVDEDLPTWESHQIAESVRHILFDADMKIATIIVHTDPCGHSGKNHHLLDHTDQEIKSHIH